MKLLEILLRRLLRVVLVLWNDRIVHCQCLSIYSEAHPFNGHAVAVSNQKGHPSTTLLDSLVKSDGHCAELLGEARV